MGGWIVLQARSRGHGEGYVADGTDWPAEEEVGPAGGTGHNCMRASVTRIRRSEVKVRLVMLRAKYSETDHRNTVSYMYLIFFLL